MKQIYLLAILSIINIKMYSQIQIHYSASINFESNSHLVEIDTSQIPNIWQMGKPNKTILNSAYSVPYGIITDTINTYPINNFSSFQIKILPPPFSCWGTGYLSFVHKYDFENKKDGGFIEVKYDQDTNWTNIIFDTQPLFHYSSNLYSDSDTIIGNIPAYTGTLNGWGYTDIMWVWQMGVKSEFHDSLTIRFSIKSDSNNTNQEGWLIDNISLQLEDCTGKIISSNIKSDCSNIYPNPVVKTSVLEFSNNSKALTKISIFDLNGKVIKCTDIYENNVLINKNDFIEGVYHYQISQNDNIIGAGKFLISK